MSLRPSVHFSSVPCCFSAGAGPSLSEKPSSEKTAPCVVSPPVPIRWSSIRNLNMHTPLVRGASSSHLIQQCIQEVRPVVLNKVCMATTRAWTCQVTSLYPGDMQPNTHLHRRRTHYTSRCLDHHRREAWDSTVILCSSTYTTFGLANAPTDTDNLPETHQRQGTGNPSCPHKTIRKSVSQPRWMPSLSLKRT